MSKKEFEALEQYCRDVQLASPEVLIKNDNYYLWYNDKLQQVSGIEVKSESEWKKEVELGTIDPETVYILT